MEDVFLFRNKREPSIGSSGAINSLKTECEFGLIALCEGKRSPAILSRDILLATGSRGSSTSGAGGSGRRLLVMHSGQYQVSASANE